MSRSELQDSDDNNKRYFISETDLNQLTTTTYDLPYMKYVELTDYKPQQFGLTSWEPQFQIPDCWMKKIYRNEVYKDTDLPEPDVEIISDQQRNYLRQYLDQRDLSEYGRPRRGVRAFAPEDDLKKDLNGHDRMDQDDIDSDTDSDGDRYSDCNGVVVIQIDSDSNEQVFRQRTRCDNNRQIAHYKPSLPPPLNESRSSNISVCRHKIQPEEVVVEMALEKMKNLSPSDDERYRELLNDKEFMKLLDQHVEKYL